MDGSKRARTLHTRSTDAESLLWQHLRNRQLAGLKFRRQYPLGSYIVDFVCMECRLIVELDGGQHAIQSGADTKRDAWLSGQGFVVLRFWNNEVLGNLESVLDAIAGAAPE